MADMSDKPQTNTRSSRRKVGARLEVSVYLLTFPNGKSYVGITSDLKRRIRDHRKAAEAGKPYALSNAWRKHGEPSVSLISGAKDYETAYWLEQLFIVVHNTKAPNGYNMTDGGDGIVGLTPEKYAEMGRSLSLRYWEDQEYRAKMQAAQKRGAAKGAITRKAWYQTDEGRASIARRTANPEWRKAMVEKAKRQAQDPTFREKARLATKKRWSNPEQREKMNAAREAKQAELRANNPDWKKARAEKVSATMRAKWQDPEYLAKMAARNAPVIPTEKRKAAAAKRMQTMGKTGLSEAVRKSWEARKASKSES